VLGAYSASPHYNILGRPLSIEKMHDRQKKISG